MNGIVKEITPSKAMLNWIASKSNAFLCHERRFLPCLCLCTIRLFGCSELREALISNVDLLADGGTAKELIQDYIDEKNKSYSSSSESTWTVINTVAISVTGAVLVLAIIVIIVGLVVTRASNSNRLAYMDTFNRRRVSTAQIEIEGYEDLNRDMSTDGYYTTGNEGSSNNAGM